MILSCHMSVNSLVPKTWVDLPFVHFFRKKGEEKCFAPGLLCR